MEAMKRIALHPALAGLPFILETPISALSELPANASNVGIRTVLGWMKDTI